MQRIWNTKNIKVGLLVSVLIFTASVLTQSYTNAANTSPGENILVSENNVDGQGANGSSGPRGISSDGNTILFTSSATNLPDASGNVGLYVRNIKTNSIARVDVSTNGVPRNGHSSSGLQFPLLSGSGRYVVFVSDATNLIDGTTTLIGQTYIHDVQTGTTSLVSKNGTGGVIGNSDSIDWANSMYDMVTGVSDDGRFVTVHSKAFSNPNPWDPYRIMYGDLQTYTWIELETPNSGDSHGPVQSSMSCDGAFVVFNSYMNSQAIHLADMRSTSSPVVVSISGNNSSTPMISCNGNYVLYTTKNKTDVSPTPSGLSNGIHLVRYDRITNERSYVDSDSSNATFDSNNASIWPFGPDAPYLYFRAYITNDGDVLFRYNGSPYLKHLSDGSGTLEGIVRLSGGSYLSNPTGTLNLISADSRYITYSYNAYSLGLLTADSGKNDVIRSKTGL